MSNERFNNKPKFGPITLPKGIDQPVVNDVSLIKHLELPSKNKQDAYSGFIIVRLSNNVPVPSEKAATLLDVTKELKLKGLGRLLNEFGLTASWRVVRSLRTEQILDLEKQALKSDLPPLHSLTAYWRIDVREKMDAAETILKRLNSLFAVDKAYLEFAVSDPVVNAGDDPYNGQQEYLDAAPDGIDARWAWTQPNGEGAGIGFVDLEQGWFLSHEDYATKAPGLIYGDNRDGVGTYKGDHGTAVLGIVAADDNTDGIVGIAPSLASVQTTSHYDAATSTVLNVADAILAAIPVMTVGDFLLLEVQRNFLPTEVDDADFDAIRLAVAHGIVVVEAAGNGSNDLDVYTNAAGDNILNPADVDFRESGAIIVGAAEAALPHDRSWFSNFGARLDCYAWGDSVVTCGYGDLDSGLGDDDKTYTDTFSGTSSASPIVTGAGIILQGMHEANTGTRLSPMQMRVILSDPATGTAQGNGVAGNIGVMPDLRRIIEDVLGVVPDVYLRDNVGDTGVVPSTGGISASPDIIVRPDIVPDPELSFGEGSGNENSNTLGYEAEAGQDNFIYTRIKNSGGADANDVTATIYWSEVSTLVTPDMWNLVGTTAPVNVPQGDTLVVTDPITWDAANIPRTGHYCFVGILDHAGDPAPPLPAATDWDGFRNFIRNWNNVAWRNFNVIDVQPDFEKDTHEFEFILAGVPGRKAVFDLQIEQYLSKGMRIWLEVPMGLAKQICAGRSWKCEINRQHQLARILLPAKPQLGIRNMPLAENAKHRSRFIVEGAKQARVGNRLAIRQFFKEEELGRVTWQFHDRRLDEKDC